jgi:hypothetical protein
MTTDNFMVVSATLKKSIIGVMYSLIMQSVRKLQYDQTQQKHKERL